jgi:branched-chain amino acid aminotransferase
MVNYNGSLFDDNTPLLTASNRAFRYGDGVFETMRCIEGQIPLFNYHFDRLLRGVKALRIHVPSYMNVHYLRNEVSKTVEKHPNSRVRLLVFRETGGTYAPTNFNPDFLIEAADLPDKNFQLNELGVTLGVFTDFKLQQTPISAFKTNNALPYILASIFARENAFDDVILRSNTEGGIAEATASNIFIFQDNNWLTPPLSSGCVGGVMRQFLLSQQKRLGFNFIEKALTINDLENAEEVILTNAVQGIRWVERFKDKELGREQSAILFERFLDIL